MIALTQELKLGEPQIAGPLTVFPVFGPEPRLAYRSFAQATTLGALVKEVDDGADVNELVLGNPTNLPLLVYEGEEVLGAQQDRTFDVSVLLDVRSTARVPVSCVEIGRWDSSRHDEALRPAPQAADPRLRATKRASANAHALVGDEARPDQGEVWDEVDKRLTAHGVESPSAALRDLYDDRRSELDAIAKPVHPVEGQLGAIAFVGGRPSVLDLVSRPNVFGDLFPRLAQGYALDALRAAEAEPDPFEAERFLDAAIRAPRHQLCTPGMGNGFRLDSNVIVGSGIEHDAELIQLCAFPAQAETASRGTAAASESAILRPSHQYRTAA